MRIYQNCVEMIDETVREVMSRGTKVYDKTVQGKLVDEKEYESKELISYLYSLSSGHDKTEMLDWAREVFNKSHICKEYGEDWFRDQISGKVTNPPPFHWKYYKEYWDQFGLEVDNKMAYTYSERCLLLPKIIEKLKENPYRRAAVLTIFETSKDIDKIGRARIPCSLTIQFLIRPGLNGDELTLIYSQRSCDLVNFFALDVYRALRLQEEAAKKTGTTTGPFIHFIGSLHAFKKDIPERYSW